MSVLIFLCPDLPSIICRRILREPESDAGRHTNTLTNPLKIQYTAHIIYQIYTQGDGDDFSGMFLFYLLLVVVFQLCIQKVQSDGLPEVNDLSRERRESRGKQRGESSGQVRSGQFSQHN